MAGTVSLNLKDEHFLSIVHLVKRTFFLLVFTEEERPGRFFNNDNT